METNLSHEQSLPLISEMINRAQNNFQKESMNPMIYWGYMIAATAIANCIMMHVLKNPHLSFLVWLVMIPCAVGSYFINRRINRTALVKTHIDKIGDMLWKSFGIGVMIFIVTIYIVSFRLKDFQVMLLINSVIMSMIGICEFASACIYRYKPWYWLAALFWTGSVACAFLHVDMQFIVLALCMILGFVIPGHLLNHQVRKSNV